MFSKLIESFESIDESQKKVIYSSINKFINPIKIYLIFLVLTLLLILIGIIYINFNLYNLYNLLNIQK